MKRVIATGKTVEDAVTSALVRLGVTRSQASVRVIREPVKGLFGLIGGRDAEVEVTVVLPPEEAAKQFLAELLRQMGLDASVKLHPAPSDSGAHFALEVVCAESALPFVIGRHGSTLDALQYLVNVVANRERVQEGYVRFIVDAADYRRRRRQGLCELADRAASRAVRTRRSVSLQSMPAADRKVIHTYLQQRSDVTTTSEGVEPNRKVVIVPVVEHRDRAGER
ncbi:MAG: protein jag [Alicyclobacillaceae bacterium]|nr:protein jag [Alicyclobacillaceae bacterium]